MAKKEGLYFCLAVWGEEYTGLFLDYCLPSQLAEGNLPAIARMLPCIYRIFATPQDAEKILNHWTFVQLRKIMSTEVIQIDAEIGSDPHATVNIFHETAVLDAREKSEWLVFLTPDNLWANMSFKNLGNILLEKNPDVVIVTVLRSNRKEIMDDVHRFRGEESEKPITISTRQLVRSTIKNLHPKSKLLVWGPLEFSADLPHHIYFPATDIDYLARGFHSHPLVMRLPKNAELESTLDTEFLWKVCRNVDRIHVVPDSDLMFGCDLTDPDKVIFGRSPGPLDANKVWRWAELNANKIHRKVFETPVRIRGSEGSSVNWKDAEGDANELLHEVSKHLATPTRKLYMREPTLVYHRLVRFLRDAGEDEKSINNFWAKIMYLSYLFIRGWHGIKDGFFKSYNVF